MILDPLTEKIYQSIHRQHYSALQSVRVLAVDIGQRQDPTAIALLEHFESQGEYDHFSLQYKKERTLCIRHLERMPLYTPFLKIVERVESVAREFNSNERPDVVVDATGVGAPIGELLRKANFGSRIIEAVVTSGLQERSDRGMHFVPKRELITRVQILMEQRRLKIAAGIPDAETLLKEMRDMRVKVSDSGNEQAGNWREGTHDDLVFAVALGCWWMGKKGY